MALAPAPTVGRTPLVGVVADPWRGETLHAVAGSACLVVAGGCRAGATPRPGMLDLLATLSQRRCTTRAMSSSTLALAPGAGGGVPPVPVIGEFHPEDQLAATLLGVEAGPAVWDETGTPQPSMDRGGVPVSCRPAVRGPPGACLDADIMTA